MDAMASQITSLTMVYSIVHSGAAQRKHQSSASLAFVRGIHHLMTSSGHYEFFVNSMDLFVDRLFCHASNALTTTTSNLPYDVHYPKYSNARFLYNTFQETFTITVASLAEAIYQLSQYENYSVTSLFAKCYESIHPNYKQRLTDIKTAIRNYILSSAAVKLNHCWS